MIHTTYQNFNIYLDVRSPKEYLHSHIPNALNIPVLNDLEFQLIGTLYHQDKLKAKILGASIACKNIANFLEKIPKETELKTLFQHKNKILIYCARGGKRSQALFEVLKNLDFQVFKLEGGYKSYRANVLQTLAKPYRFITLCGPTGCGKSELLQNLNSQSIDLETLAHHYGSSFGHLAIQKFGAQPTQKMFENILALELEKKAHFAPLFIEAESKKLGNLIIPYHLYNSYHCSTKILITAPLEERINRIVKLYQSINEKSFLASMQKIKPYLSNKIFQEVNQNFKQNNLYQVAHLLITQYYDKVYKTNIYDYHIHHQNTTNTLALLQEVKEKIKNQS